MNKLPDDILDLIYKYKHNLQFSDVMEELLEKRLQCRFNVTLDMCRKMRYLNHEGVFVKCINIDKIDVVAKEIFNIIKFN